MKQKHTQKKQHSHSNSTTINNNSYSNNELKIKLIVKIIFWGFVSAFVFNFIYQGIVLHKEYPYNTFLFLQTDRFNDYFNMREWCKNMNPYFDASYLGNSNYLPIANVVFWLFSLISKQLSLYIFIGLFSVSIYLFSFFSIPKTIPNVTKHKYAFVISFLSYAYLFCFDRANLEPYVAIPIMAFLFFYLKQQHQLAIILLAIAAATKIYPIIFVLLYVSDKKYKEVVLTSVYTIILILVPLYFQKGGFEENLNFILNGFELDLNTASFVGAFEDKGNQMIQGTSLFSVLKIMNIKMTLGISNMLNKYFVFVALFALFVVLYVVLIEKILWKKVTLLTCLIIILPHISFDYKLIHLLFCLYLFINETKSEIDSKLNYKTITVIFGLLLVPKSYFYFSKIITTTTAKNDVPMGTLFNPLLMMLLCYMIIKSGLKNYEKSKFKFELQEHFQAIKKSLIFILPLGLIIIPYYSYSKKAKANYTTYKKHFLLANDYLANNKKNQAIIELDSAFNLKPYQFKLPLQIANIYNELGKIDSAEIYYNKVLKIFPGCIDAENGKLSMQINDANSKAITFLNNQKYEEAVVYFNKTINSFSKLPQNPNNQGFIIGVYTNLSVCYINTKKWNDAKKSMNELAKIDPNNQFLLANMPNVSKMIEESKNPSLNSK